MADKTIRCSECEYCKGYSKGYAHRKQFYCEHENQQYINSYFESHKISKSRDLLHLVLCMGVNQQSKHHLHGVLKRQRGSKYDRLIFRIA